MTPATPQLTHDALLYSSTEELVDGCAPFVRDGIEHGERVFCAVGTRNLDPLREALGPLAGRVDFCDATEWYRVPARTLGGYSDYLRRVEPTPVRVVGEVAWSDRTPAGIREWARYESILNSVFASAAAWIVCPYDTRTLPDEVLEHALRTHPTAWVDGRTGPSGAFVEPAELSRCLDDQQLEPPPADAVTVETESLRAIRDHLRRYAARVGVHEERCEELVLAVNEVAANVVRHGTPPIAMRLWVDRGRLLCEVTDRGPGMSDPQAGWVAPVEAGGRGSGLWLARTLSDLLEVRSGGEGTTVRLHAVLQATA